MDYCGQKIDLAYGSIILLVSKCHWQGLAKEVIAARQTLRSFILLDIQWGKSTNWVSNAPHKNMVKK